MSCPPIKDSIENNKSTAPKSHYHGISIIMKLPYEYETPKYHDSGLFANIKSIWGDWQHLTLFFENTITRPTKGAAAPSHCFASCFASAPKAKRMQRLCRAYHKTKIKRKTVSRGLYEYLFFCMLVNILNLYMDPGYHSKSYANTRLPQGLSRPGICQLHGHWQTQLGPKLDHPADGLWMFMNVYDL